MDKRLFLIDGSAQMYRAHFAFIRNPLKTSRGELTSAIFGFLNMLISLIEREQPSHLAIVFDTPEPTFRHKVYADYKATRQKMPEELVEQLGRLDQVLRATGIPILAKPGWEADDVIGTLARRGEEEGFEVFMVTGDKDYQQLVTDRVRMYSQKGSEVTILGPDGVREKFGVPPEQVVDVMALVGDASDNVPGVAGIGPKTGVKLIQEHGSLDNVLKAVPTMKKSKLRESLERDREQALFSRDLVTIDTAAPVDFTADDFIFKSILNPDLERLLRDLELYSLLDRLGAKGREDLFADERSANRRYHAVTDAAELEKLISGWKKQQPLLSFDLETTSTDPMQAEIVGASFSTEENQAVYVPVDRLTGAKKSGRTFTRFGKAAGSGTALLLDIAAPVLEDQSIPKTGQNIKYDSLVLKTYGIQAAGVTFDTILAAYLLEPGSRRLSIDALSADYLKLPKISIKELIGSGKSQISMRDVPLEKICEYACEDADYALRLTHHLKPLLKSQQAVLERIELPLMPVLEEMEFNGIKLDVDFLSEMSKELDRDLQRIEKACYKLAGGEFNLNSPKQLSHILFEELGLPVQKKLKTGPSTDVDTLTALASMHELPERLLDFRMLSKLKSTYVDALPVLVHPQTGRLHTTFSQTVAATGRLSSANPNLQNIPIRTEIGRRIREAFVPGEEDWVLLSADYSQIELRIMAHLSGDKKFVEAFLHGGDIHRETAARIFEVEAADVDADMRRAAKTVNFGIIYGQTDFGLSQELGIPRAQAREFRENYFKLYPGVAKFMEDVIASCRENGYVETIFGRRRKIPDITAKNRQVREFAERTAINTPVQGSAADMIKLAMIAVYHRLKKEKLEARMLLQVHDELVFEVPSGETEKLSKIVIEEMQNALEMSVPVVVECGFGENWLAAH